MNTVVFTLWVVGFVVGYTGAIPPTLLYDNEEYGVEVQNLLNTNDVTSPEVRLNVPIVFFGIPFDTLFISSNGLISFQTEIQQFLNVEFPLNYPIIAPFYSHVDTTKRGSISYYETDSPDLLHRATKVVQDYFSYAGDFQATSIFVVTWHGVGYFREGEDKVNTFQIVITSDGEQSYVEFLYPENGLQWIQGTADESGLPDARAQAGIISPDGKLFTLPGSGTEQVKSLERWSNMGLPGQFVFRVDQSEIQEPDQNTDYPNHAGPPQTCAEATTYCHIQATCQDYQEGFCCQCSDKFYGNGRSCVRKDLPLRVNGKVTGVINGEKLDDLDLQSYIVMNDGRAYTAISKIPEAIGSDIQSLQILGGVIGYTFAKPLRGAENGYQLTGGVFNHSATITFLNTSQVVRIKQKFLGLDVFDQLRLEADVRGEIPNLPNDVRVTIDEYQEEYTLTNPGVLQMTSRRSFKYLNALNNEEIVYVLNVDQSITFESCKFENRSLGEIWKLRVGKNFISYEAREQIIRFGLSNKIVPFGDADPCDAGRSRCGPHSSCVIDNDSYRCMCNPGYQEFFRDNQTVCVDIDECRTGQSDCDYNAECVNTLGGFTCLCNPGYEGNGHFCEHARSCTNVRCPENSECVASDDVARCTCQAGFTGDGLICSAVVSHSCEIANNCSPQGYCSINPNTKRYYCSCLPGYEGNGYDCRPLPPTTTDASATNQLPVKHREVQRCLMGVCWCPEGLHIDPESHYCLTTEELAQRTTTTEQAVTVISESCEGTCHRDAQCIYSDVLRAHVCQCNEGLEGDGYTCTVAQISCNIVDNCDPHATCTYNDYAGKSMCKCNDGYDGDGYTCYPAGEQRCGDVECTTTEDCRFNSELQTYECICKQNYHRDSQQQCVLYQETCGGGVCVENAECLYDEDVETEYCACKPGYIGDGIIECTQKPVGCDTLNNCGENAVCQYDHSTTIYTCRCREGFLGDGILCYTERTCQIDPNMCHPQATCITDQSRSFSCKCNSGFLGNGTYCKPIPIQSGNFLLLNYGQATLKLPTEPTNRPHGKPIQIHVNQVSVGLDIDCLEGRVYWTDIINRAIRSSNYDGTDKQDFIKDALGSPEGLAIDWVSRNIYWTDSTNDTIEVANIDSKRRRTLFSTDLVNPRGIAVHPQRGKIFWSDWNRINPKIEWANADGSGRQIFLNGPDVSLPNALTIDYDTDNLCYSDAGTKKIECINIDTRVKQTIVSDCTYPFGIATTDRYIYWSDWILKRVERVDKRTLQRVQPIAVQKFGSGKLYGLVAVPNSCPRLTNVCEYYKDQCPAEHICLPNGSGSRSCLCSYRSDKLDEQPTCVI